MPKISQYPSMIALTGPELLLGDQAGATATATAAQVAALAQGGFTALDSGAANVYVLTTSKPLQATPVGQVISFIPAHANTGASTANVNGGGAIALVDSAGNALTGGEILGPAIIFWTGAVWKLLWTLPLANKRTAVEISKGVTPTNFTYLPGDMRRYGVDLTGGADSTTAMQNCINCSAGAGVVLPNGTYKFTSLTAVANLRLSGQSRNGVILNSITAGTAIQCAGFSNLWFEHFTLNTTNAAASGMEFGTGAQHIGLQDLSIVGASGATAGIGIFLNSGSPGAFSGNFLASLIEVIGYKVGVAAAGVSLGLNTWTSMAFENCFLSGNSSRPAGSIGLWFDSLTNGVGSFYHGGSVEGFDTGVQIDNGSSGLEYIADNEGNNTTIAVGATFSGQYKFTNSNGNDFQAACNGAANRWWQRQQLNGVVTEESYFNRQFLLYDDGNSGQAIFGIYRGPQSKSFISGTANPTFQGGFVVAAGTVVGGSDNYLLLSGQTIHWDVQSPETTARGTWAKGDVCFNTNIAVGQPNGWRCTVAGAPGTWVAMNNL